VLVSASYIDLLSVLVFLTDIVLVFREQNMVQHVQEIVAKYEDRLREMQSVLRLSYGHRLVRTDGAPNRMFLTCLFVKTNWQFNFSRTWASFGVVQCNTCE